MTEPAASLCFLLLVTATMASGAILLLRKEAGRWAIGCFIAAAAVSLHYFLISNDMAYTNDLGGHVLRVQNTMANWLDPYGEHAPYYRYHQNHHPPLYYYAAGAFLTFTNFLSIPNEYAALRLFSWVWYQVFIVCGLLCLHALKRTQPAYAVGCALVALWPVGLMVATKISPEPMFYGLYAVSFYYTLRWALRSRQHDLFRALAIAGLALLVRTNALFLFGIVGILGLVKLLDGSVRPRARFAPHYAALAVWLLLCAAINLWHVIGGSGTLAAHIGHFNRFEPRFKHYISYDLALLLEMPYKPAYLAGYSFWEYLQRTALFGEYEWQAQPLTAVMQLAFPALVAMLLLACAGRLFSLGKDMRPMALGLIIPLAMLVFSSMGATGPTQLTHQDFRFIHPVLIAIAAIHMRCCDLYLASRARIVAYALQSCALLLIASGVIFYWLNGR